MTALSALNGATIAFELDGTLVESAADLIGAVNATNELKAKPLPVIRKPASTSSGLHSRTIPHIMQRNGCLSL